MSVLDHDDRTDTPVDYLPRKVTHVGDDGKRTFDAEDKRRLIEACRQPGVSLIRDGAQGRCQREPIAQMGSRARAQP